MPLVLAWPVWLIGWALLFMNDAFADVTALSDAESQGEAVHQQQRASRKRKLGKKSQSFADLVSDETGLRAMLGKPKCHCRKQCLMQFVDDSNFAELLEFRQAWASLHKLDQDTEVRWFDFLVENFIC